MTGGALKRDLLSHLRMASGKRVPNLTPKSGHAKIVVLLDKKEQGGNLHRETGTVQRHAVLPCSWIGAIEFLSALSAEPATSQAQ